ncbi:glycosyltransferase family 39 protein [Nostoc sp. UHCC 0870]|uniref:glycosyltransferase family 39 protein n=1 Tax=Nostoc sp. UHCC 0870 TaxID=2914041 RepID=UPI001EE02F62|nr:glycosyltransferase family 39 protein [Nostoc sp. UHCC 0870]UKO98240.1 glycosyltransferase family 39 protein [Nostoc sp. UHCC 0870]
MTNRRGYLNYLGLLGAIALGAVLRFWHLDLKPLWMDEVITAIFSLGKNYHDLPLDVVFTLNRIPDIFTFQPGVSCIQIANNIATQSTHPPLFFCGMYRWMESIQLLGNDWVTKLRSLPVLFGIAAIVGMYGVNCIAFSPTSGIIAALLMAVSPFAVYLSQEARHYTLPMFLITLSLLLIMEIQRDILQGRVRFWCWFLWVVISIFGFYSHYFFILAFIAEIATLSILIYWSEFQKIRILLYLIISSISVFICFMPWVLITLNHAQGSETNWLPNTNIITPFYHTIISLVLMIISLPLESQSLMIMIICGSLMLIFAIWAGLIIFKGLEQLLLQDKTYFPTLTLISFTSFILLQCFAIAYLSGKDITAVPRYSFIYYPSVCSLLAASICHSQKINIKSKKQALVFIFVGLVSSTFIVYNFVFQKPFMPEKVALNMNLEPSLPLMLVVTYESYQDVALGLSFALALEKIRSQISESDNFVALKKSPSLPAIWTKISQLSITIKSHFNLWIVAPGIRRRDYPQKLILSGNTCIIDTNKHYRIGIPYQLYRCSVCNIPILK